MIRQLGDPLTHVRHLISLTMPNVKVRPPPTQLLRAANPADDAEFDRLAALCLGEILGSPEVRSERLPPGRRAWFEAFLRRCLEGAALNYCPRRL